MNMQLVFYRDGYPTELRDQWVRALTDWDKETDLATYTEREFGLKFNSYWDSIKIVDEKKYLEFLLRYS